MQRQAHEDRPGNSEASQRIAGTTRPEKVETRRHAYAPSQRKVPKDTLLGMLAPENIKKFYFSLVVTSRTTGILFLVETALENNENIFTRVAPFYEMQQKQLVENGRNARGHKVSTRRTVLRPSLQEVGAPPK